MYKITKRMEISAAHRLKLPYDSPCTNLHGHNWIITVELTARELNADGMVLDFKHIKNVVKGKLDHTGHLGVVISKKTPVNPTAENIAKWVADKIGKLLEEDISVDDKDYEPWRWVSKVTIQESDGNTVCYIP